MGPEVSLNSGFCSRCPSLMEARASALTQSSRHRSVAASDSERTILSGWRTTSPSEWTTASPRNEDTLSGCWSRGSSSRQRCSPPRQSAYPSRARRALRRPVVDVEDERRVVTAQRERDEQYPNAMTAMIGRQQAAVQSQPFQPLFFPSPVWRCMVWTPPICSAAAGQCSTPVACTRGNSRVRRSRRSPGRARLSQC
jgi:hypothetical protein